MGRFPGALHEPYPKLRDNLGSGGLLSALGATRRVVFFCAYGERSAMAVQAAQEAGITSACHIQGGIAAWKDAGGPVERAGCGPWMNSAVQKIILRSKA